MTNPYEQGISQYHALKRTSPKGGEFIGVCTQCGKRGLRLKDQLSEQCENWRQMTQGQSILEAIEPRGDKQ